MPSGSLTRRPAPVQGFSHLCFHRCVKMLQAQELRAGPGGRPLPPLPASCGSRVTSVGLSFSVCKLGAFSEPPPALEDSARAWRSEPWQRVAAHSVPALVLPNKFIGRPSGFSQRLGVASHFVCRCFCGSGFQAPTRCVVHSESHRL